jgi:hypothetical protein
MLQLSAQQELQHQQACQVMVHMPVNLSVECMLASPGCKPRAALAVLSLHITVFVTTCQKTAPAAPPQLLLPLSKAAPGAAL